MNVFDGLNPQQIEAVAAPPGPLLLVAGAGSGKTLTMVRRIGYHIKNRGVHPSEVMAVTFTRKAAEEIRQRLAGFLGKESASMVWAGTFHSLCLRLLKMYRREANLATNFSIYDADDSLRAVRQVLTYLGLEPKLAEMYCSMIEREKSLSNTPDEVQDPTLSRIYDLYQNKLSHANALDFQDIILKTIKLLEFHKDIRFEVSNRFKLITVDEFQDTNIAQVELIRLLTSHNTNVTCIGDPDQSIYSFRHAEIENILDFRALFPESTVLKLEQNYRSTPQILEAANHLIGFNSVGGDKKLWTDNDTGCPIKLYQAKSVQDEMFWVANQIRDLRRQGIPYGDITILYRMNFLAQDMEQALTHHRIPYQIFSGVGFYQRDEIKNVAAYLRLFNNPHDDEAFKKVVNVPKRGIGDVTLKQVLNLAKNESIFSAVKNNLDSFKPQAKKNLKAFIDLIEKYQGIGLEEGFKAATVYSGYVKYLNKVVEASTSDQEKGLASNRIENLVEMQRAITTFVEEHGDDSQEFLESISLIAEQDTIEDSKEHVKLMTVHASKGLEFKNVFIIGFDDGIFPSYMALDDPKDVEEERRLAYVAITRAEERVFISYPSSRIVRGKFQKTRPSRFIKELPKKLVDFEYGYWYGSDYNVSHG